MTWFVWLSMFQLKKKNTQSKTFSPKKEAFPLWRSACFIQHIKSLSLNSFYFRHCWVGFQLMSSCLAAIQLPERNGCLESLLLPSSGEVSVGKVDQSVLRPWGHRLLVFTRLQEVESHQAGAANGHQACFWQPGCPDRSCIASFTPYPVQLPRRKSRSLWACLGGTVTVSRTRDPQWQKQWYLAVTWLGQVYSLCTEKQQVANIAGGCR